MFQNLADRLAETALSQHLASTAWAVPVIQTIHILGIAALFTMVAMLSVRLIKPADGELGPGQLSRDFNPFIWSAFIVLLLTGGLMIVIEPARELLNPVFWIKMGLVTGLVAVTAAVQRMFHRACTDSILAREGPRLRAAAFGVLGLMLCVAAIAAGRLIAYV
jgi:hypothetical protein